MELFRPANSLENHQEFHIYVKKCIGKLIISPHQGTTIYHKLGLTVQLASVVSESNFQHMDLDTKHATGR